MATSEDAPLQQRGWAENIDDAAYRSLVDSVRDYAIFFLDPNGYIRSWTKGAERIKGYRADEIIGKHLSRFFLPRSFPLRVSWFPSSRCR